MNREQYQQGGIIAYAIVGVVLLGLLAGGVYLAKHQARLTRDGDPVVTQTPETAEEDNPAQQPSQSNDNESQPSGSDNQAPSDETPAQDATPPAETDNTPDNDRAPSSQSSEPANDVPATGPSDIAATGPAETAAVMVALGSLSAGVAAYLRATHRLHSQHRR